MDAASKREENAVKIPGFNLKWHGCRWILTPNRLPEAVGLGVPRPVLVSPPSAGGGGAWSNHRRNRSSQDGVGATVTSRPAEPRLIPDPDSLLVPGRGAPSGLVVHTHRPPSGPSRLRRRRCSGAGGRVQWGWCGGYRRRGEETCACCAPHTRDPRSVAAERPREAPPSCHAPDPEAQRSRRPSWRPRPRPPSVVPPAFPFQPRPLCENPPGPASVLGRPGRTPEAQSVAWFRPQTQRGLGDGRGALAVPSRPRIGKSSIRSHGRHLEGSPRGRGGLGPGITPVRGPRHPRGQGHASGTSTICRLEGGARLTEAKRTLPCSAAGCASGPASRRDCHCTGDGRAVRFGIKHR